MRLVTALLLLTLLVLPLAAEEEPPAPAVEKVTFTQKVPPVGLKVTTTKETDVDMEMSISQGGQEMPISQKQGEEGETYLEILASDEDGVTKMRVEYVRESGWSEGPMGAEETSPDHAEKTYLLTRGEDGEIVATTPEGEAVPEEEAEGASKIMTEDGWPGRLTEILDGKTLAIGEELELEGELAAQLLEMGDDAELDVEKLTLKLIGTREVDEIRYAVLEIEMKAKGSPAPMIEISMEAKGFILVQPETCWPGSIELEGTMKVSGGDGVNLIISGNGTITMKGDTKYEDMEGAEVDEEEE